MSNIIVGGPQQIALEDESFACFRCDARLWVSQDTLSAMIPDRTFVCVDCFTAQVLANGEKPDLKMTNRTYEKVSSILGKGTISAFADILGITLFEEE